MLSRLMTRREQLLLLGLGLALFSGALALLYHDYVSSRAETLAPGKSARSLAPVPAQDVAPTTQRIRFVQAALPSASIKVGCMGAIEREGLYRMSSQAHVHDLIQRAGGLATGAEVSGLNLAAPLVDGSTLRIPWRGEQSLLLNPAVYLDYSVLHGATDVLRSLSSTGAESPAPFSSPILLNSASRAELESLPGIGPALAGRIEAYRSRHPFQSVEELVQVSGIGPHKLEAIRALVAP